MKFNNGYIAFAFQTEKDTAAAAPLYYMRLLSGTSIGPDREVQVKRTAESGRASDGISAMGAMGAGGTVNFVAQPSNVAAVLYGAMGAVASTGSANPYSHAITPEQDDPLPWITAWAKIDTINMLIPNLKISNLKLVVSSADRLVVGQMELMGAGAVQYKTTGPTLPSIESGTRKFAWDQAKGSWVLDGSTVGYIHTFEWNVNNNLTGIPGEDYFFYDIQEGPLDLDYAAVISIIDASEYNTLVWGSATPSDAAEPTATVATGSFSTKFTCVAASPGPEASMAFAVTASEYRNPLPKLQIDPDGKPQDLRLEARCTGTDPKATVTVKNNTATIEVGS